MTQDAKPVTADKINALRRHLHCTELVCVISNASECNDLEAEFGRFAENATLVTLLATIDQQAKQLECGDCGNPKGFAILCADCWSHYYRSVADVTSAAPVETPTIAYWRRNAHEAFDNVL